MNHQFTIHLLLLGILLAAGCGVRAGNPSGDPQPRDLTLSGRVTLLEPTDASAIPIALETAGASPVTYATASTDGSYQLTVTTPGQYVLRIARSYAEPVEITQDTILNVLLPIPAPPEAFRFIDMGPRYFCLLWRDKSGLEAGFQIEGELSRSIPANRVGIVTEYDNAPSGYTDYEDMDDNWNAEFAGHYYLWAFNEYGQSVSRSVEVEPYTVSDGGDVWSLASPPVDPRFSPDPDVQRCLDYADGLDVSHVLPD